MFQGATVQVSTDFLFVCRFSGGDRRETRLVRGSLIKMHCLWEDLFIGKSFLITDGAAQLFAQKDGFCGRALADERMCPEFPLVATGQSAHLAARTLAYLHGG